MILDGRWAILAIGFLVVLSGCTGPQDEVVGELEGRTQGLDWTAVLLREGGEPDAICARFEWEGDEATGGCVQLLDRVVDDLTRVVHGFAGGQAWTHGQLPEGAAEVRATLRHGETIALPATALTGLRASWFAAVFPATDDELPFSRLTAHDEQGDLIVEADY